MFKGYVQQLFSYGRKTEYPKQTTFFHIHSATQSYQITLFTGVLAQKRLYNTLK